MHAMLSAAEQQYCESIVQFFFRLDTPSPLLEIRHPGLALERAFLIGIISSFDLLLSHGGDVAEGVHTGPAGIMADDSPSGGDDTLPASRLQEIKASFDEFTCGMIEAGKSIQQGTCWRRP